MLILGAGIGGLPMAYEMKHLTRPEDKVTAVSNTPTFHFVPSNPWVGVNWRGRGNIEFEAGPYLAKKKIDFFPATSTGSPRGNG